MPHSTHVATNARRDIWSVLMLLRLEPKRNFTARDFALAMNSRRDAFMSMNHPN
jgi:hypothetical protein